MRNLKRALSLAMASVMLVGTMVVGSSASYVDVASEHNTEAIEVLQAVGIMTGDEKGNFNPDANVTRNEMAVIMCNLMDYVVSSYKGTAPFTDVPDWAADYVAACYTNEIVAGVSATQYGGDNSVTTGQAALMLMKALGYFKYQGDFADDWLVETTKLGTQKGIFDGVDNGAIEPLTRNQVAQMILNTLEADAVEARGSSGVTIVDGNLVAGRATYDPRSGSGSDKKFNKIGKNDYGKIQLGEELYNGDLEKFTKQSDDFGRPATQWKYKGNNIGKYADTADYVLIVDDDYTKKDSLQEILRDLADNSSLELKYTPDSNSEKKVDTTYWLNGAEGVDEIDLIKELGSNDKITKKVATYGTTYELFMADNQPDAVEKVVAYNYTLNQITDVDTDVSSGDAKKGITAKVSFEDKLGSNAINNTDIPGFDPDTYVEDAYVAMVINEKDQKVIDSFIPETVEGSIGTKKGTESVTVDGERYYAAATIEEGASISSDLQDMTGVDAKSDDTYRLYLDRDNRVLAFEGVEAVSSLDDVYYVDTIWEDGNTVAGDRVVTYYAQLVSLEDGTKAEYKLEKDNHKRNDDSQINGKTSAQLDSIFGGELVTISDKKSEVTENGTKYSSKANNEKWNLKLWEDGTDKNWVIREENNYTNELKKSTRSITVGDKTYRLGSSTVYLFMEKSGSDLSVSRYVGGVAFNKGADRIKAIKDADSNVASYVLFQVDDADQAAEYSEDVIFLYEESDDVGDGYIEQTVYLPDGTEDTWQIADGEFEGAGFYTYTTNDDGYYELKLATNMKTTANLDWQDDKEEGTLDAWIFGDKDQLYEDLLTVTKKDQKVTDIDVSDASFKDVRPKSQREEKVDEDDEKSPYVEYKNVLNSLDAVKRNMGNSKGDIESAELYLNVSKDGAVSIFLTEAVLRTADKT